MKYPDGNLISAGDLIWWNEGSCVGYVQSVVESKDEFKSWSLDRPHLFLSNIHPFDPAEQSGIVYDEECLSDEGVGFLTSIELGDLTSAIAMVQIDDRTFSVFGDYQNGRMTHWRFESHDVDSACQTVRIPIGTAMTTHQAEQGGGGNSAALRASP